MIRILEENEYFIVLSKDKGVSVHNEKPSVADYLMLNNKPLHFVNRLDQDTSGIMIVAKSSQIHTLLSQGLETTGVKTYGCLLRGSIDLQYKSNEINASHLNWNWPITDKAEGRKNPQGVSSDRKSALTLVKVIRTNKYFTEISAEIKTGRQHQIRKHAALAKHPIVGDSRYNEPAYNSRIEKIYGSNKLQLHAKALSFYFENQNYSFEDPISFDAFFLKM